VLLGGLFSDTNFGDRMMKAFTVPWAALRGWKLGSLKLGEGKGYADILCDNHQSSSKIINNQESSIIVHNHQ